MRRQSHAIAIEIGMQGCCETVLTGLREEFGFYEYMEKCVSPCHSYSIPTRRTKLDSNENILPDPSDSLGTVQVLL